MKAEPLDNNDEAYLVQCCKNNDPTAQKVLYNKYVDSMLILCLRYIVSKEDAREVLMDSFLKFFNNIDGFTYQGEGSVRAWLNQITVNQCLMQLRKRQPVFIIGGKDTVYEGEPDGDEDALSRLATKEILKLVQCLPDGYRIVFNLYVFDGMNHREIGELLNISEQTSKSQLHRARAILKEQISGTVK